MPLVQVTMLQGRTADQKRKIAQRITDTMVEEAGARREAIVVTFIEVSKESYASGGVLMADRYSGCVVGAVSYVMIVVLISLFVLPLLLHM